MVVDRSIHTYMHMSVIYTGLVVDRLIRSYTITRARLLIHQGKGSLTMGQRTTTCPICKGEGEWYCADCQVRKQYTLCLPVKIQTHAKAFT